MLKDDILQNKIKNGLNVAKFISFSPERGLKIRHCCIDSYEKSEEQNRLTPEELIELLFNESNGVVSIRTFKINQESGNPVFFDQTDLNEVIKIINEHTQLGYYVIVNEGLAFINSEVSGVMWGSIIEFAPAQSPRCVEKENNTCLLPVDMGIHMLKLIYNTPNLNEFKKSQRVEFSVYPYNCGVYNQNTIIWEVTEFDYNDPMIPTDMPKINWPNPFSRVLGDKVFGLLVADYISDSFLVPKTIVLNKYFSPFTFGIDTCYNNSTEYWCRSCPSERLPGQLPSVNKYFNLFDIMKQSEKLITDEKYSVPSIIVQQGIKSLFSGSVITTKTGKIIIEGVKGKGDLFMLGSKSSDDLPSEVINKIEDTARLIMNNTILNNKIEFEWSYDGFYLWILQLSIGQNIVSENIIVEGNVDEYLYFNPNQSNLNDLMDLIKKAKEDDKGILITGNVGLTSHIVHLLNKEQVPSIIKRS